MCVPIDTTISPVQAVTPVVGNTARAIMVSEQRVRRMCFSLVVGEENE